ncbi:MAG: sugar phosphate isomerase/epimerase family protein [Verrucomicrobiota bacterium]|nr:sugar phosphate isomerase/epimerase family protein [Verrucomicrobiota bacterium]
MITIGIASDNFRHDDRSLAYVFNWCKQNGADTVEINTVNGEDFFEGLGFSPSISLNFDGIAIAEEAASYGLKISQIDCHYGIHRWQSIPYMINGIKMARDLGCPAIATTDGAEVPKGMTLEQVYERAVYHIGEALPFARTHKISINVEPHGPLTNNLELMIRLMKHFNDPFLGINFDTANTFIAGNDPVAMTEALLPWIRHFHVKDVAPELKASIGKDTGIAASEVYVGQGINADNIRKIVDLLQKNNWSGVMSLEAKGEKNTLKSLEWFRAVLAGK